MTKVYVVIYKWAVGGNLPNWYTPYRNCTAETDTDDRYPNFNLSHDVNERLSR